MAALQLCCPAVRAAALRQQQPVGNQGGAASWAQDEAMVKLETCWNNRAGVDLLWHDGIDNVQIYAIYAIIGNHGIKAHFQMLHSSCINCHVLENALGTLPCFIKMFCSNARRCKTSTCWPAKCSVEYGGIIICSRALSPTWDVQFRLRALWRDARMSWVNPGWILTPCCWSLVRYHHLP